ncbi:hypothetical protein IWQ57_005459 [Coemansia nantahalensis]|uniref:Uncharacterized protein n=1 Tax=Coemansia nantahalensis TaxID=2789366 RepID=A0ACC1JN49_9FUNG|nr:hypothetical protein IWQ57_005459 [Coemansia nantahalensis]
MRFIEKLKLVTVPDARGWFEKTRYWADTGRLNIIKSITIDSINHMQRYFNYLSVEFLQQRGAMRHDDAVQTQEQEQGRTDGLDDLMVGQINNQPQAQSPAECDSATGNEIADICMYRASEMVDDLEAGRGLKAATVMQIMYQAGYLAPVSECRVAIPNPEVYDDLARLYRRLAAQHSMDTRMSGKHIKGMGICNENMPQFAKFLCKMLDRLSEVPEKLQEVHYRRLLCSFLAPAETAGFMVTEETYSGNGRVDILMAPTTSPATDPHHQPACFLFELKNYDGTIIKDNTVRMGDENRQQVAAYALGRSLGAQTQIYQRYFRSIAAKIEHCTTFYDIGLSFWMNRFCMIVTKRVRSPDSDGADVWPACRFAGDDADPDIDLSHANLSEVTYGSLGDSFSTPGNSPVRTFYRCGRLIAISI